MLERTPLRGGLKLLSTSNRQETVFMGNGEKYIWKPPEEDDMAVPQRHLAASTASPPAESDREHSLEVSRKAAVGGATVYNHRRNLYER